MEALKVKSLSPYFSDQEIKDGCHSISFCSFERVIKTVLKEENITDGPIGYRITEQGIELVWD